MGIGGDGVQGSMGTINSVRTKGLLGVVSSSKKS